jgi:hypothetical protein
MGINDVRRRRFWAIAGAYRDAALALPALLRKRREVQATRRVEVGYIDSIIVHELPPTQRTLVRIAGLRLLPRRVRESRR